MDDLVFRLRHVYGEFDDEAADEIESLRAALKDNADMDTKTGNATVSRMAHRARVALTGGKDDE
jgi:hypothetical protein